MVDAPYRVRVNLGNAEFDAEGDKDTVMEQYRLFLDAVRAAPPAPAPAESSPPPAAPAASERPLNSELLGLTRDDPSVSNGPSDALTADLMARIFSTDRGVVSLRLLPQGRQRDADAILMLLYGYAKLQGETHVLGTALMKAARQSGILIDRIDRVIAQHNGLFIRGGARKGARYALNNQGEARAKAMIEGVFG